MGNESDEIARALLEDAKIFVQRWIEYLEDNSRLYFDGLLTRPQLEQANVLFRDTFEREEVKHLLLRKHKKELLDFYELFCECTKVNNIIKEY